MSASLLLGNLDRLVRSSDAVASLRRLALELAMRGRLVPNRLDGESAWTILERISFLNGEANERNRTRHPARGIGQNNEPYFLPPAWAWTTLGYIGEWGSGSTPLRDRPEFYGGEHSWLKSGELNDNRALAGSEEKVTDLALETCSFRRNRRGDVLIAMYGATIGKVAILAEDAVTNQAVCGCTPHEGIQNEFLFYYLLAQRQLLRGASEGGAQPNISKEKIIAMPFPLPPFNEQIDIANRLNGLMAFCDDIELACLAETNARSKFVSSTLGQLESVAIEQGDAMHRIGIALNSFTIATADVESVDRLRAAVLNLGIRGRLTEQDASDEPAHDLLNRILLDNMPAAKPSEETAQQVPFPVPDGWTWIRLGRICSKTGSGSTPRGGRSVYRTSGVPFLRSQNVHDEGLRLVDVAYIDDKTHLRMQGTAVKAHDLLLNITGGSIGRCALVPEPFGEANVSQHVAIIRLLPEIDPEYIHKVLLSPYFQSFIIDSQTGAGRGGLPKNRMDRILIPLPPAPEQRRIVEKINELLPICDNLKKTIETEKRERQRLLDAIISGILADADRAERALVPSA